jgi:hypothetical protein
MVEDGQALAETLRYALFRALCFYNLHKLGVSNIELVPLPEMRLKTAADEVKTDKSDRAAEIRSDEDEGGVVADPAAADSGEPAEQPAADVNVQQQALNGAQVTSLIDLVAKVANGEIPRASAVEIAILAFQVDRVTAERVLGAAGTEAFEPKSDDTAPLPTDAKPEADEADPAEPADPKAPAPVAPGQTAERTQSKPLPARSTRRMSAASPNLFVQMRSLASGTSERSSSKR